MNNKGFMMAEVVVVSAVILVTLTGLYMSYNKVLSIYNQRINYYDVKTIYSLADYRETNHITTTTLPLHGSNPILNQNGTKVFYIEIVTDQGIEKFKESVKSLISNQENTTFNDYINYLSGSLKFEELKNNKIETLLIMEKCKSDGKSNCKYAYLEVFD